MKYEIKELSIGQLLPIMDLIQSDPKRFQMEMVKLSVCKDGAPLGEAAMDLPVSEYLKLAADAMAAHDFSGEEKKA